MSEIISIDEIKNGMVLAEDIKNRYGQLLIAAETVLNEKHVRLLKTWGVSVISIVGEGEEKVVITEEEKEQKKKELLKEIGWKPDNPFEEDLINMAAEHKLEQLKFYDTKRTNT
ncbi:hypothetical protein ACSSWA_07180 [Melioribacter sp. Ez-97]|uniref:hypothetical protein n=1 Tax=Melioribacter sp. Ez-97 TaxID=3423434 RepID=UPI003EDAF6B6